MVVRAERQQAVTAVRFENALGHGDARRDAVAFHLLHGDMFVAVDVLFARLAHLRPQQAGQAEEQDSREEYCFFGNIH